MINSKIILDSAIWWQKSLLHVVAYPRLYLLKIVSSNSVFGHMLLNNNALE